MNESPTPAAQLPAVYTLDEAKAILRISRQKLSRLVNAGEIGHYRVDGFRVYIRSTDILEFQRRHENAPTTPS